jgi:general secretion pathway protein G
MYIKNKKAFTMIELVFVIVIIGVLASVAIPRLAATRDDAVITKARTTIATIRNALAMERQKRVLRGDFKALSAVGGNSNGGDTYVFGNFFHDNGTKTDYSDDVDTGVAVMEYPVVSQPDTKDKWSFVAPTATTRGQYKFNSTLGEVIFEVVNGKFICDSSKTANTNDDGCTQLTR